MISQNEEISCPFCHEGKVKALYVPSVWSVKSTGKNALGSGKHVSKSAEQWDIQSDCSNCGKTATEIKKALKDGVPPDKEKLKRRYEEIQKLREEMKKEKGSV